MRTAASACRSRVMYATIHLGSRGAGLGIFRLSKSCRSSFFGSSLLELQPFSKPNELIRHKTNQATRRIVTSHMNAGC
jgi:hypothetical protein